MKAPKWESAITLESLGLQLLNPFSKRPLRPHLSQTQKTVGVHVDLSHSAATPVGMTVTAEVELIEVEGSRLRFKVVCRDNKEVVCEGYHDRYIVETDRFLARLAKKKALVS